MNKVIFNTAADIDGVQVDIEVEAEIEPYNPGRVLGPPDECEPPSGGGCYGFVAKRCDTKVDITKNLCEKDFDRITNEAYEEFENSGQDDDGPEDDDYEPDDEVCHPLYSPN